MRWRRKNPLDELVGKVIQVTNHNDMFRDKDVRDNTSYDELYWLSDSYIGVLSAVGKDFVRIDHSSPPDYRFMRDRQYVNTQNIAIIVPLEITPEEHLETYKRKEEDERRKQGND